MVIHKGYQLCRIAGQIQDFRIGGRKRLCVHGAHHERELSLTAGFKGQRQRIIKPASHQCDSIIMSRPDVTSFSQSRPVSSIPISSI